MANIGEGSVVADAAGPTAAEPGALVGVWLWGVKRVPALLGAVGAGLSGAEMEEAVEEAASEGGVVEVNGYCCCWNCRDVLAGGCC